LEVRVVPGELASELALRPVNLTPDEGGADGLLVHLLLKAIGELERGAE
jgi:hypothetical protein